jgi:long-subunit acyl-CoA synthetase (AMP-forming)
VLTYIYIATYSVFQVLLSVNTLSHTNMQVSEWGKNMGMEYAEAIQLGGNGRKPFLYGTLAEGLVQKKVKDILGLSDCKFAFTGAAPISVETLRYFASVGIHINEVYGMSECTGACTWSTNSAHIWGSVGWAIPGCEVKVFKVEGGITCVCVRVLCGWGE